MESSVNQKFENASGCLVLGNASKNTDYSVNQIDSKLSLFQKYLSSLLQIFYTQYFDELYR